MNTPATSNSADYSGEQIAYKDSTYELVSKVAFLIGVPQRILKMSTKLRSSMFSTVFQKTKTHESSAISVSSEHPSNAI